MVKTATAAVCFACIQLCLIPIEIEKRQKKQQQQQQQRILRNDEIYINIFNRFHDMDCRMCVHFGMWNLDSSIRQFVVTRRHFNVLRVRHLQENTQIVAHQVSLSVNSKIKNQKSNTLTHTHNLVNLFNVVFFIFIYFFSSDQKSFLSIASLLVLGNKIEPS